LRRLLGQALIMSAGFVVAVFVVWVAAVASAATAHVTIVYEYQVYLFSFRYKVATSILVTAHTSRQRVARCGGCSVIFIFWCDEVWVFRLLSCRRSDTAALCRRFEALRGIYNKWPGQKHNCVGVFAFVHGLKQTRWKATSSVGFWR
jgi:hypothetical protein